MTRPSDAVPVESVVNPLSERDFQKQVVELAKTLGYKVYHPYRSDKSEPGWPDLALVKGDTLFLWELKTERGKLSPAQTEWMAALQEVREVRCALVKPSDWNDITRILSA